MKALGPHLKEELNVPYHPEACEYTFFEVLLIEIYFDRSHECLNCPKRLIDFITRKFWFVAGFNVSQRTMGM